MIIYLFYTPQCREQISVEACGSTHVYKVKRTSCLNTFKIYFHNAYFPDGIWFQVTGDLWVNISKLLWTHILHPVLCVFVKAIDRLQVLKQVLRHMTLINKPLILCYKRTMHQLIAIKIRVQNYTYPLWETWSRTHKHVLWLDDLFDDVMGLLFRHYHEVACKFEVNLFTD